jgi:hypothetical protein
MSWTRLEALVRGDSDWTNIPTAYAREELNAKLAQMKSHGFKVKQTDHGWEIKNPLTKQIEVTYRLVH